MQGNIAAVARELVSAARSYGVAINKLPVSNEEKLKIKGDVLDEIAMALHDEDAEKECIGKIIVYEDPEEREDTVEPAIKVKEENDAFHSAG